MTNKSLNRIPIDQIDFLVMDRPTLDEAIKAHVQGMCFTLLHDASIDERLIPNLNYLFEQKFGRPPGDDDPFVWDYEASFTEPIPLSRLRIEEIVTDLLEEREVDPALIYAWQTTGLLLCDDNDDLAPPGTIPEFEAAVERARRLQMT